jgi:hypothetical protein
MGGRRVVGILERLAETRELPDVITMDKGGLSLPPWLSGDVLNGWEWRHCLSNPAVPGKTVTSNPLTGR